MTVVKDPIGLQKAGVDSTKILLCGRFFLFRDSYITLKRNDYTAEVDRQQMFKKITAHSVKV